LLLGVIGNILISFF